MNMEKDKLELLLKERHFENPRADFAAGIARSARMRQRKSGFVAALRDVFAEFSIPYPAYAVASLLLIGASLGFSLPAATQHQDIYQAQQLLSDDGGF